MNGIREAVRNFVLDSFLMDGDASILTDEMNLHENGILDSFSTLKLVSFLEDRFQVRLEAADLEAGSLSSLVKIEQLVATRTSASQSTDPTASNERAANARAVLGESSAAAQSRPAANGLYERFRETALLHADRLAIVDGGTELTYADLIARVSALCDAMRQAGIRQHDRALLVLGNNSGFVIALLAAWKLGIVPIPLNPLLQEEELLRYVLDSQPKVLMTSTKRKNLASLLDTNDAPIEQVWLYSSTADNWMQERTVPEQTSGGSFDQAPVRDRTDWPALTQYSTGSTGTPKRITRTHGQLVGEFMSIAKVVTLHPTDRVLGVIPFYHSHGLKNAALLPLFAGASLYALDTFFPRDIARLIEREKVTAFPGVPFMFQQLSELRERHNLSSVRLAFSGSAPMPQRTALAFEGAYGIKLRRVYGTTETGLICVERDAGIFDDLNRAGVPIPGVTVEIVDEDGNPVPAGVGGRVKVTSPFAASNYDHADKSSSSYFKNGSYFPGDTGWLSEAGELVVTGRNRGFINVGGNKVDAAEVEAALLEITGVCEAAVVGVPDALSGERVKAVLVTSTDVSSKDIRAHLSLRLADFKHPRVIEFRKELPKSPLGKLQRRCLANTSRGCVSPRKTREVQNRVLDSTFWNDFQFRDGDVVICTWAKSGTTWLQQIVGQLIFAGAQDIALTEICPWLEYRGVPMQQKIAMLEAQQHRRFIKTHLPVDALVFSPQARYIYVGRDGRDVVCSMYDHLRSEKMSPMMQPSSRQSTAGERGIREQFHDWLDKDGFPFWPYWSHVQSWWQVRHLPNVLLVHFANLKAQLAQEIRRVASFLEISIDPSNESNLIERCSFQYMKANARTIIPIQERLLEGGAPNFFSKGVNGRWHDVLTPEDIQKYEAHAATYLSPDCAHWLATGGLPA